MLARCDMSPKIRKMFIAAPRPRLPPPVVFGRERENKRFALSISRSLAPFPSTRPDQWITLAPSARCKLPCLLCPSLRRFAKQQHPSIDHFGGAVGTIFSVVYTYGCFGPPPPTTGRVTQHRQTFCVCISEWKDGFARFFLEDGGQGGVHRRPHCAPRDHAGVRFASRVLFVRRAPILSFFFVG